MTLPGSSFSPTVMNHPIHKIAFVCDQGTGVCFIVKRPGEKHKFKCHFFDAGSSKIVRACHVVLYNQFGI